MRFEFELLAVASSYCRQISDRKFSLRQSDQRASGCGPLTVRRPVVVMDGEVCREIVRCVHLPNR